MSLYESFACRGERDLHVEAHPSASEGNRSVSIVGYLTAEYREPSVLAMGPSGHIHRIEPKLKMSNLHLPSVASPVLGCRDYRHRPAGPIPLAQIDLYVERKTETKVNTWPNEGDYGGDPALT